MNTNVNFNTVETEGDLPILVRLIPVKGDKGDPAETDQHYNPTSENAQSGKAVEEAVYPKADKSTTYTKSEINAQMQNKQAKFADVESEKFVVAEEVFFVGDYRIMPQYSEPNIYDIINREMLENYHDNSKADKSTVDNHITDKNNPHAVTKIQVGLGNVDNTADVDKPISRATEAALGTKQNTIAQTDGNYVIFDREKRFVFVQLPISDDEPNQTNDLVPKWYADNKLAQPSNIAVGKYFRVASIDADGHAVLECVDPPTAPVQSVSAAGTALPPDANGNVDIGYATTQQAGLVKSFGASYGIQIVSSSGRIYLTIPNATQITNRNSQFAVTLNKLDDCVKAAMTDGLGAAWTDAERLAALLRMGCTVDANGFVKWTPST